MSSVAALPIDANTHQGYFAEALVAAIAAAAGLDVMFPRLGHGIDLNIYQPGPKGSATSKQMTLQVKSWSTGTLNDDGTFHYPLEVPAYNFLAGGGHDVRHYLAMCIVPASSDLYADVTDTQALLRHAAYWLSLRDETPDVTLNPLSRKTVRIPKAHLLTPDTITHLLYNRESSAVVA
jgi:hypothetical protein